MTTQNDRRSVSDLLATALTQLSLLAQTEIRLARTEIGEKIVAAGTGMGLVGVAAVLAIPALVLLLMSGAALLVRHGLSAASADAIAGAGALILAVLMLLIGLSRLRGEALKPKRTLEQLHRDAIVAKEHLT